MSRCRAIRKRSAAPWGGSGRASVNVLSTVNPPCSATQGIGGRQSSRCRLGARANIGRRRSSFSEGSGSGQPKAVGIGPACGARWLLAHMDQEAHLHQGHMDVNPKCRECDRRVTILGALHKRFCWLLCSSFRSRTTMTIAMNIREYWLKPLEYSRIFTNICTNIRKSSCEMWTNIHQYSRIFICNDPNIRECSTVFAPRTHKFVWSSKISSLRHQWHTSTM